MVKPTHEKQLIVQRLDKAVEIWLLDRSYENRSPRTISFYREFTQPFIDHVGGDIKVHQITEDHIRLYFAKTMTEHIKSGRFRALKAFLRWCVRHHYLWESPLLLEAPKVRERVKETFSQDDYNRMLRACSGHCLLRDRAIVMVFWDTGARLGEMERMDISHVSMDAKLIKVLGKGNKERLIPIRGETRAAIWAYLKMRSDGTDHLWISNKGGFFSARGMHLMIRRLIHKAGITFKASPHTFRHSLAVRLLSANPPLSPLDVQYILGHTSLEMVRRYSRHQQEQRAIEAMRKAQDREGLK